MSSRTTSVRHHQLRINRKLKKISQQKYRAWRRAKTTDRPEDWDRFRNIKMATRRLNRQSYQHFINQLKEDDSANYLWRLIKSKRSSASGIAPLKRNGLAFSDSKTKTNILNDQFCNALTREDTNNMPSMDNSHHPTMQATLVSEKASKNSWLN